MKVESQLSHDLFCEQTIAYRKMRSGSLPDCENPACEGHEEYDMDEDVGPVRLRMPNLAGHAVRTRQGSVVLLCGDCMEVEP